jgi:hypothetical protein
MYRSWAKALVIALLTIAVVAAQIATASISGTVTDPTMSGIPNVTVTFHHVATSTATALIHQLLRAGVWSFGDGPFALRRRS